MNRRQFLRARFQESPVYDRAMLPLSTGLEPFVPDAENPWDATRVGHLLRRTTMLPARWQDIQLLLSKSPSEAVDLLLDTPSAPPPFAGRDVATESLEGLDTTLISAIRGQWASNAAALRKWYVGAMMEANLSIVEKMTLFWSGHFTTEFVADEDYVVAPLLYRQNQLFRSAGLANFRDLVASVTLDGGMLVYLGGNLNSVGKPNENYARELLELFTTGLGWYTEGDIQHAARILTGWRVAQYTDKKAPNGMFNVYFEPALHDINAKVFMAESFPARDSSTNTEFIVQKEEIRKLIDTIFEKRPDAIAKFIARKLYRFFVYSNPTATDAAVIDAMAALFIQNNFEIKPVLSTLLKSAHFFDNANIGAQIKTPAEFMVGLARQLDFDTSEAGTVPASMAKLDQDLFDPPNVSGWPGWQSWITTTTYPLRADAATTAISGTSDATLNEFIKQFPNYTDADSFMTSLAAMMLPRKLSAERKSALISRLVGGGMAYEWEAIVNSSPSTAARNLRDVLTIMSQLPDFQLN